MTITAPAVATQDVNSFEDRLTEFLGKATPDEIREAVYRASVFIEDLCKSGGPEVSGKLDQVNNATSTFCRCTRALMRRIAELEEKLASAPPVPSAQ